MINLTGCLVCFPGHPANVVGEEWVHIDTFGAMNGISRFCEEAFPWRWVGLILKKEGGGICLGIYEEIKVFLWNADTQKKKRWWWRSYETEISRTLWSESIFIRIKSKFLVTEDLNKVLSWFEQRAPLGGWIQVLVFWRRLRQTRTAARFPSHCSGK